MPKVKIVFMDQEKETEVPLGVSVLQALAAAGVPVEGNCGGKGACGKCAVKILSGSCGDPTPAEIKHLGGEKLAGGWVLACRRCVTEDIKVEVQVPKDTSRGKANLSGLGFEKAVDPSVEKIFVGLAPPTVEDQTPDLERLLSRLPRNNVKADPGILAGLPGVLRESGFKVTATLIDDRLMAVEKGDTTRRKFGLAFDIGTTTLAGYLLDLNDGEVLAASSKTNPQKVYGADVIARISHAATGKNGLKQLQEMVLEAVNEITRLLLEKNSVEENEVYEAVVVGNTTMAHLFLGIDPTYLASAPFIPAFKQPVEVRPGELGLPMHPSGRVLVLPNIAGYVGSDTVGVMLATRLDQREGICLAVDIGTNGEVVLAGRGRILTCSTAAGPAFEGSHIKHGLRAAEGAIEAVHIDGDVFLKVIGHTAPRGICGSGLIDAVAGMLRAGIIDSTGRFADTEDCAGSLDPRLISRLRKGKDGSEFLLASGSFSATGEDIVITQKDLRELQLAKGAILAGIRVLLKESGVAAEDITEIFLAGAFGNYVKKESAMAIGLLPSLPLQRIVPVGNAAGDGAMLVLFSKNERAKAFSLSMKAEHVELSARKDFQEEFINSLYLPGNKPETK